MIEEEKYEKKYVIKMNTKEDDIQIQSIRPLNAFGKRLRDARKSMGFSQEEFANKVQLHRTYISDIERGKKNVSLINIAKLAEGLNNMDISELMTF